MHSSLRLSCSLWHQSLVFHCQWSHNQVFPLYACMVWDLLGKFHLLWQLISSLISRNGYLKYNDMVTTSGETDQKLLSRWSRMTHICVSELTIRDSDNGVSPGRPHAIIWPNYGTLLIKPLGTNFSEIWIEIYIFTIKKCISLAYIFSWPHHVNRSSK